ncbi:MAG TPA: septum site-determining protein MinC [Roseiarcus sp.]|nr:septum site-determining protein MinC [Roseiarcus sp.]
MNAHVTQAQALNFKARSLLAFALEPGEPLADWFASLDAWLIRSPTFFASKPVILEMSGVEISLKDYRRLLSELARRHIRVMGVENASATLVGPHLPPAVTGGRTVNAPTTPEESAEPVGEPASPPAAPEPTPTLAKPERANTLIIDGNVRSGQSIMHAGGDVTVVGRVASGAEIVAGGSVHVYGALQGRVIAGISGEPGARIFCTEARAELLCIGGAYVTAENMNPQIEGRSLEVRLEGDELKLRTLD